jgi:MtfA peptidase
MWWKGACAAAVAVSAVAVYFWRRRRKRLRRLHVRSLPFPDAWCGFLDRNLPVYATLDEDLKRQLHGLINVFVDEKKFEGCGGLEVTDEIKVTIAAQACLLLLNRETRVYPTLSAVLVYPEAYRARTLVNVGGQMAETDSVRLGESWSGGAVVLAWDDVLSGVRDFRDGHNVVLHEFAHQLDQEDGRSDGAPILEQRSGYVTWARVLGKEYKHLRGRVDHHRRTLLDGYGATAPAEFFAVATETFFEKASQMQRKRPELYEELKNYYKLDPAAWPHGKGGTH